MPQQQPDKAGTQITILKAGCLDALLQLVGASSVVLRSQVHLSCPKCRLHAYHGFNFTFWYCRVCGDFLFEHGQQVDAALTSKLVTAGAAMRMAACGRQPCLPAATSALQVHPLPSCQYPAAPAHRCFTHAVKALWCATCYHLNWLVMFDWCTGL